MKAKIVLSGINENGLDVELSLEGDTPQEVLSAIGYKGALSAYMATVKAKPVKSFGGFGGNKKPETVHLPEAPVNANGEKYIPVSYNGKIFWSLSKFNRDTNKYDNEYPPKGTPPPTLAQLEKFYELNPHIAAKAKK